MQNWEIIHVQQQHSKSRDLPSSLAAHQFGVRVVPQLYVALFFFFHVLHFNILCVSLSLSVCGYRRLFLL
jgi:hypothetical protein